MGPAEQECLKEYIDNNLKLGRIKRIESQVASPVFFIAKRGSSEKRLCVDYRGINSITKRCVFPLPRVDDILDLVANAKYFSVLDLREAYHLLRVREQDEWKTAFRCKEGVFAYTVMPFGLQNAPSHFQAYVNAALDPLINKIVVAYLDDLLVFSDTYEQHLLDLEAVMSKLKEAKLRVKESKCQFVQTKVSYLGFRIGEGLIEADPERFTALHNWPTPVNLKQVMRFIGFVNFYHRFVPNFSKTAAPLHNLTKKDTIFTWGPKNSVLLIHYGGPFLKILRFWRPILISSFV